ncbi:phosphotransferase [Cellulomonas cellasea]|uniref:Aminoglycoside phosphotransferase domain-containing protein n=1 Tax=Cellulomonas cellasea TaxID=43670 RepID=A0A7W4UG05_9CELL|nr:phosphotransferase [Cellulomonas cellasea]MBB2923505.1 hypothetical protein [Cellulomonas cellasea]
MDADEPELVLASDGVTRVLRRGDTVRRPVRPFTATVQAFLAHLHERGFDAAPLPLGHDEDGREVLSFVPGDVPVPPLPGWAVTLDALVALARLVRRAHDAAEGWEPPADAVWGDLPGATSPRPGPTDGAPPGAPPEAVLVAHQDYCPGNVVFRDGLPVALIDFDLARPTTRVADAVNALHWWAPLVDPVDRSPALAEADAAERVRVFADAYGMTAEQRALVVPRALWRARRSPARMLAAAEADPVFRRWWDEGVKDRAPRAAAWLAAEAPRIAERLR